MLTRTLLLQVKIRLYGKLTPHACLTTPLRNLTLFRFCLRPSSIGQGLYLVHLGRFLAVLTCFTHFMIREVIIPLGNYLGYNPSWTYIT